MKKILLYALVVASAAMTFSCKKDDTQINEANNAFELEQFLALSEDSAALYCGSGVSIAVDIETDQIAYADDRSVYMVSNMDCTQNYTLNIDGELEAEQKVMVEYTSMGYDAIEESGSSEMYVAKVDDQANMVWLWDSENMIGFIMHFEPIE
ncbi:MAG: hypothetical protein SNI51_01040 [Rikenellaceae bacterium]